jgi:4a-hydroxytetrahydrobiopterin dehydratase
VSDSLVLKKCLPCEIGTPPISESDAAQLHQQIPDWQLEETLICREFKFPDFITALEFVNKVGRIAEEEGHHPDIFLSWGKVKISLTTHAAKGLTENDFVLAAKIDQLLGIN